MQRLGGEADAGTDKVCRNLIALSIGPPKLGMAYYLFEIRFLFQ